ncbi:MAG TPA: hypothetical protein VJY41_00365 [Prolixibacteraceae bacterium]|nr:hypothetical protein [Prolixibacteraceae bacterium]
MIKITRNNYETWFIDLIDGILSNQQLDMVLEFLRQNPDLQTELNELKNITLQPLKNDNLNFNHLLKSEFDHPEIFEETCIRYLEKDLLPKNEIEFQHYLSHNKAAQNELKLFELTVLQPDTNIVYPHTSSLQKTLKIPVYWLTAAALIVFAFIFWFNKNQTPLPNTPIFANNIVLLQQEPTNIEVLHFKPQLKAFVLESPKASPTEQIVSKTHENPNISEDKLELLSSHTVFASTSTHNTGLIDIEPTFYIIAEKDRNFKIFPTIKELLAEIINKKVEQIEPEKELNKITFLALNRLNDVTNNKFDYNTNEDGKLSKLEYNSRFLAFSIPVNTH